ARPTRSISQPSSRSRREFSSARATPAARTRNDWRDTRRRVPNIWAPKEFVATALCRRVFLANAPAERGGYSRKNLARRRQLEQSAKVLRGINAHNYLLQLIALILTDHAAAERSEFHRDFVFGHRIARIAFWNVNAS